MRSRNRQLQGLVDFVRDNFPDIKGTAEDVVGVVSGLITGDFDSAMKSAQSYAARMKRLVISAWNTLKATGGRIFEAMKGTLTTTWETIDTTITNIASATSAQDEAPESWRNLKTNTYTFFNQMGSKIGTTLSNIAKGFSTHLTNAKNTVNRLMSSIASIIRSAVQKVINFWNRLDFRIPAFTFSWGSCSTACFSASADSSLSRIWSSTPPSRRAPRGLWPSHP